MRAIFSIFLSALLFSGCSQKHTAYVDQSVDIVAGKEIVVRDYVITVKKREGSSIEGVHIVRRESDGKETTITADTGTLAQAPKQSVEAQPTDAKTQERLRVFVVQNSVTMTLSNALVQTKTQSGTTKMMVERLELAF
jgi:uncharacterized GH25 family protein